ncbi:uncharacterized protein LOC120730635 isoform X1 [Simochromis diagramma]|uniref:uncharacterized protein LOC120730635 isoform X1 n=1 Tax=Simochromis diagramma TaxID=43689 RepID=UPI001A7EDDDC|nr:uncharacterized protein LOC120730635 isoform X1 [Simochromis diagramma]
MFLLVVSPVVHTALCIPVTVQFVDKVSVLVSVGLYRCSFANLSQAAWQLFQPGYTFPATCVWVVGAAVSPGSLTHTSQELRSVRESRLCPGASVSTTCFKRPAGAQTSSTGSSRCGAAVQVNDEPAGDDAASALRFLGGS